MAEKMMNKSQAIRDAIKAIGPNNTIQEVKDWIKRHHPDLGEIASPAYYNLRKEGGVAKPAGKRGRKTASTTESAAPPFDFPTPTTNPGQPLQASQIPELMERGRSLINAFGSKDNLQKFIQQL